MAVGTQKGLTIVCLSVFIVLGCVLRLHNLGTLNLVADEGIQALKIEGISKVGYPLMPSGLIDTNSLLVAYSQYLASVIFGLSEFSIRLPGVVFNLLAIGMIYVFGRSVLDKRTALLAAFLLTFSVWEIELSRYGRMYTLFQLCFLVSLFCFYKGFIEGIKGYRIVVPIVFIVTFSIHAIGLSLLILFLFPFIVQDYDVIKKRMLCLYGFLSFGGMFAYTRGITQVRYWLLPPASHFGETSHSTIASIGILEWTLQKIDSTLLLPPIGLLKHLYSHDPMVLLILGISVLGLMYVCWSNPRFSLTSLTKLVGCSLIIVSSAVYQFSFALVGLYFYVLVFCHDTHVIRQREVRLLVFSILGFFAFWLFYTYSNTVVGGGLLPHKYLYRFPNVYEYWIRWYASGFPLMLLVAVIGFVWLRNEYLIDKHNIGQMFLLFSVPAFIVFPSFFYNPWYESRYTFHVHPLILIVFSFAILRLTTVLMRVWNRSQYGEKKNGGTQNTFVGVVALVLAVVFSQDSNPKELFEISERNYATEKNPIKSSLNWMPYGTYVQDYQSTAYFVKNKLESGDHVLVLGGLYVDPIYYYYMRKTDYVLFDKTARNKSTIQGNRHYITGSEILMNTSDLRRVLDSKDYCRKIWIVADRFMRTSGYYDIELRMLLDEYAAEPVFIGRDQKTFVYVVDSCASSNPL